MTEGVNFKGVSINQTVGTSTITGNYSEANSANLSACQGLLGTANSASESALQALDLEDDGTKTQITNLQTEYNSNLTTIETNETEITQLGNLIDGYTSSINSLTPKRDELYNQWQNMKKEDFEDDTAFESRKAAVKAQYDEIKGQIEQAEKDKGTAEKKKGELSEKNKELRNKNDNGADSIKSQIEKLTNEMSEKDKEAINKVKSELSSAQSAITQGTSDIRTAMAQQEEEAKKKENEEGDNGFDYKDAKGNILNSEQLRTMGVYDDAGKEKIADINKQLSELMGDEEGKEVKRIDASDGLNEYEMNLILSLNGKGAFSSDDTYSGDEITSVLGSIGARKSDYTGDNGYIETKSDSFTFGGKERGFGLKIEDGNTKTWRIDKDESGKTTFSEGIVEKSYGWRDKTHNHYEYTESNGVTFVNRKSETWNRTYDKDGNENSKTSEGSAVYSADKNITSDAKKINGRSDATTEVSKFLAMEIEHLNDSRYKDIDKNIMAEYINTFYHMFKSDNVDQYSGMNEKIKDIVKHSSYYYEDGTTIETLEKMYYDDSINGKQFVQENFPEVAKIIDPNFKEEQEAKES